MQYLLNFGTDVANAIDILIGPFCYVAALVLSIGAVVALQSVGRDPRQGVAYKGGIILTFAIAAALLSFDGIVNMLTNSVGGNATMRFGGSLLSYSAPPGATATLKDSILAIVERFRPTIQAFGALSVLFGLMKLKGAGRGGSGRPGRAAMVHFVCGAAMINIQPIVATFFSG